MKKPMQKYAIYLCYATYKQYFSICFTFFITKAPQWGFCYTLSTLFLMLLCICKYRQQRFKNIVALRLFDH